MKARIENDTLYIEVPVSPEPTSTGKGVHVYSTHGWVPGVCSYKGAPVSISMNATCRLQDIKKAQVEASKEGA